MRRVVLSGRSRVEKVIGSRRRVVSDISITRFQPASVTREKVSAVTPADNESGGLGGGSGQGEHPEQDAHESPPAPSEQATGEEHEEDNELKDAVARLNAYVQRVQRDIVFNLDDEEEPSVTVFDRSSRKVLRHINGEEARKLARRADDEEDLNLFDTRV